MNLAEFVDTYRDAIAKRVVESYPPLYRPSENGQALPHLIRSPIDGQADAIRGVALSLKAHRGTSLVGEMGTGKSFIGAAAAYMAGFTRILVILPAAPGAKVEEGDRGDGPGRSPGHSQVHNRPGGAAALHRLRPPLCCHVAGEGQAVLQVEASRDLPAPRGRRRSRPQ